MEVTDALRNYAQQKVGKLTKYYDRIQEIEVVFDATKEAVNVEVMVHAEHRSMFVAHMSGADTYASIDGCVHKLERQLTEHKQQCRNRKHPEPRPA